MKKGFTLIELLAVIVILAIIALIATPIILNIINDAKEESQERSVELYINGVELAVVRRNLTEEFNPTECAITEGMVTCTGYEQPLNVEVDGEVPESGTIVFENNKVTTGTTLNFAEFTATVNKGKVEVGNVSNEETEIVCRPATTKAVAKVVYDGVNNPYDEEAYVDGELGLLTTEVENKYAYGVTYLCDPGDGVERTFFVLEDGDNTALTKSDFSTVHYETDNYGTASAGEISLIMINNVGSSAWNSNCSGYECTADTAVATLQSLTSGWNVTINLPTYAQIKQANSDNGENLPTWITANTYANSFWTSTAYSNSSTTAPQTLAWGVSLIFGLDRPTNNVATAFYIRPVITVPKTQIG